MESEQFKAAKELLNKKLKELGAIDENKAQRVYESLYDENKDKEIVALSIEQKCALLNAAASLYTIDNMPNNRQEAKQVLVDFMQLLGLENKHLTYCIYHQSWLDRKKYIDIIKTIQKDDPFIQFICTCKELIDLGESNMFINYTFTRILKDVGFSQEDIYAIVKGKYNYRFDSVGKEEPVEETNLSILQSWSLLEFAKNYVKMKVGTFVNSNTGEEFKSCMFFKKDGNYDYVGFHSQLGELTPAEISKRKRELKVGLTQLGKYVLYDHIDDWENVDLGI
uniref:Uncharacterized protein n=1 Tax=CrAss-like virus sp. ctcfK29 TaxID=2826827 RepID=A0A8S5MK99_9CAUD|nr:MAG TPA: hypothetical protein [CrAss-like virus sp. ctcfK29]